MPLMRIYISNCMLLQGLLWHFKKKSPAGLRLWSEAVNCCCLYIIHQHEYRWMEVYLPVAVRKIACNRLLARYANLQPSFQQVQHACRAARKTLLSRCSQTLLGIALTCLRAAGKASLPQLNVLFKNMMFQNAVVSKWPLKWVNLPAELEKKTTPCLEIWYILLLDLRTQSEI